MRNGSTDLGTLVARKGGLDGGGWVTGIGIADDGTMVCRTDCGGIAGVRGPSDTEWTQLFRFGVSIPMSEYATKILFFNDTSWIYEAAIAPSNSNRIYASFIGFLWRSNDRAGSWTKLTGYKASRDQTMTFRPHHEARVGGQHMAVHPTNPDVVVFGHPVDGASYSTDAGATWTACSGVLAPVNATNERRGINISFDRTNPNTVVIVVEGRGVYRSTTGVSGTFSLVGTGYPTQSASVCAANGRIFVIGTGTADSQLYMWNGTAWSQPVATGPENVTGFSVDVRPTDTTKVCVMTLGGGMHFSTDSGDTWTPYLNGTAFKTDGAECPYFTTTNNDFMSLGRAIWHPTANRIVATCGIGVFTFDNPPRTSQSQLWADKTLGIQQKLVMDVKVTPSGRVLVVAQDKPLYIYERNGVFSQPTINLPDSLVPIRHGLGIDFAADDADYLVLAYEPQSNDEPLDDPTTRTMMISTDGGVTWNPPATVPTYGSGTLLHGGNVAVGNVGNIVWAGTNDGPVRVTTNGGTSWSAPNFRATSGGSVIDVTGARWHRSRGTRRIILWADKATPGRFLIYIATYLTPSEVEAPFAGLYESTDGGLNFIKVKTGCFNSASEDAYEAKLRPVPGYADHLFFARGNVNSFGAAPAANGLKFSTDKGATTFEMTGWEEVEDIGFGRPKAGNSYPRLLVRGFRGGNIGYYYCDDFNPSSPGSATWTLWTQAPGGRVDDGVMITGDMGMLGRFYAVTPAGGFQVLDRDYKLRAS